MAKCSRCSKPTTNRATKITVDKVERFYNICGYCMEDLEEFLSKEEDK